VIVRPVKVCIPVSLSHLYTASSSSAFCLRRCYCPRCWHFALYSSRLRSAPHRPGHPFVFVTTIASVIFSARLLGWKNPWITSRSVMVVLPRLDRDRRRSASFRIITTASSDFGTRSAKSRIASSRLRLQILGRRLFGTISDTGRCQWAVMDLSSDSFCRSVFLLRWTMSRISFVIYNLLQRLQTVKCALPQPAFLNLRPGHMDDLNNLLVSMGSVGNNVLQSL
jgi:hypothetical protein